MKNNSEKDSKDDPRSQEKNTDTDGEDTKNGEQRVQRTKEQINRDKQCNK